MAGRRLRGAAGAHRRQGRGRLPGHPAGAGHHQRQARPLRAQLARRERHPQGRARPRPAGRLPAAPRGHRWLTYREGLNAVRIEGGHAGNVIPDFCAVTVNYRFAPDRSEAEALAHVRELFDGFEVEATDSAPGALPGLSHPAAAAFVESIGTEPAPRTPGRTSPSSLRSACPRSTTAPAIRSSHTPARSM
ncbi:peptidase dimerization domain-containing protein [Streptomyces sp. FXJ1.4098]|nr:peptidase dimerization domain-containing protein [Streptomyces sp. FXJ1.4098]